MFVFFWMCDTSAFDPRGITRSISLSSASSAPISAREVTSPITPLFTRPEVAFSTASTITLCSIAFDFSASRPPFSNKPLPLRSASAAICGSESGRDSKITMSTPIGTDSFVSSTPSDSSMRDSTLPIGSSCSASERMPATSVSIFADVSCRRFISGPASCFMRSRSRSAALAARISARCLSSPSATACSTCVRSSVVRFTRARDPSRHARACAATAGPTSLAFSCSRIGVGSSTNRVPDILPSKTFAIAPGFAPLVTMTAGTPQSIARIAASIFACIPPRPTDDLAPNWIDANAASPGYVGMRRAEGSDGGRS
mmetsp:Transcript_21512/g.66726  ORF Transcript_21512/g.66726 Transcript_21512/m.66726 type:complete len:314 (-) Transcript_21512:875-1816(-)